MRADLADDRGALEHARADRDVGARRHRRFEPRDLRDRRGPVRVRHQPELADGPRHARANRVALAAVPIERVDGHAGPPGRHLADAIGGPVLAAVVHHDDLVGLIPTLEIGLDLLEIVG